MDCLLLWTRRETAVNTFAIAFSFTRGTLDIQQSIYTITLSRLHVAGGVVGPADVVVAVAGGVGGATPEVLLFLPMVYGQPLALALILTPRARGVGVEEDTELRGCAYVPPAGRQDGELSLLAAAAVAAAGVDNQAALDCFRLCAIFSASPCTLTGSD